MSDTNSELNIQNIAANGLMIAVITAFIVGGMVSLASSIAHGEKKIDAEAINSRILPIAKVELAAAGGAAAAERTGEQLYAGACVACHGSGAAGAPKLGDNAAWEPRLGLGLDGLLKSAIKGKNAMPPKGGADASDLELARAIVYLANASGGKLKEPTAK